MHKHILIITLLLISGNLSAKMVEFSVDMTGQTVSPNGVHVSGDFQEEAGYEGGDWQSNTTLMTNEAGSEIYSVVVDIPAFTRYEYKFINGDQWYEVEFVPLESRVGYDYNDNRWVYVDSLYNDTTIIPPVMFSGNAPMGYYLLRLKVDMALQEQIDPAGVYAALDNQNFNPAATALYSFVDKVYEQIIYTEILTDNAECYYRFVNGNTEAGLENVPADCARDGYRFIEIPKDSVLETVCFGECAACDPQGIDNFGLISAPKLSPNPFKNSSTLEFNDQAGIHYVTILDLMGKTVWDFGLVEGRNLNINRENLMNGIYFLKISDGKKWLSTLRMIITN